MPTPTLLEPKTKAPAFHLADQDGTKHRLSQYQGQTVVLYFYPKDDTPGCTVQACEFRDQLPDFKKINAVILGISPDDTPKHRKFVDKFNLNFTLLADPKDVTHDNTPPTCHKYGVWQQKSMYGRKYMGVARTTYIINPQGKIMHRFDKVKPKNHAHEILEFLAKNSRL